jgi:excisionase family DNA binding protein
MPATCRTLSVREASAVLGLGAHAVYQAVREGRLPALRLHRKLRIPILAIERVLKNPGSFSVAAAAEGEEGVVSG